MFPLHRLRALASAALAGLSLLVAGCAGTPLHAPSAPAFAQAPRDDSRYAPIETAFRAKHGAEASGFLLLESNADGLKWRLAVVDTATHSLDLQYYVWFGDVAGQLLLARVVAAADRGVKVRLLLDDLTSLLTRMTTPELRDDILARIDAHPNIQVRVFNGWRNRDLAGRLAEGAGEFGRIHRRMHNKQLVADNRVAIIGGRNVGDEYMGLNPEFNFHDLDVLGVGPVARQASAAFDRYWNSAWVGRIPAAAANGAGAYRTGMVELPPEAAGHPAARRLLEGQRSWAGDVDGLAAGLVAGHSTVLADPPARDEATANVVPGVFRALMRSARREVLITNAYIIPDAVFIDDLRELAARGVKVAILTNSLASHDVPAVNAHYEAWRKPILATGAALHELRADAAIKSALVDTPPVASGFVGLHTKAMVVDRERSFIGSMNMDPRSQVFNSEMGVIVESPALAASLAVAMLRDAGGANSWRVTLAGDGSLRWTSDAGEVTTQPARGFWQRVQNVVFKLFPSTYY